MNAHIARWLLPLALAGAAGCTSDSSSSPPAFEDPTVLCELVFGRSSVQSAEALLGQPTETTTFDDGAGTLDYEDPSPSSVKLLELDFAATGILTGASTLNLSRPACWAGDAGVADTSGDASTPTANARALDARSSSEAASADAWK